MGFKEYVKEISIVILGILIAFWINNLGVEYKEYRTRKQILYTMLSELEGNNKNIYDKIEELKNLSEDFDKLSSEGTSGELKIEFHEITLVTASYETAKYTGIFKDIDYSVVSKIVGNYERQESCIEFDEDVEQRLFSMIGNGISNKDNLTYLIKLIDLFVDNLEAAGHKQKVLIKALRNYLESNSFFL
ncbi:MAG: hypothetical protein ACEPOW_04870 [Bacteroidales bacterium]